tara:strand:+ start:706 stop:1182 length:477 start_codon:yes stop_codon:yes gene_type:complete
MNKMKPLIFGFLFAICLIGCGSGQQNEHEHTHSEPHHHEPPHGGAGVTLGEEDAHIEFLAGSKDGIVYAWFFKPHMSSYLRVEFGSFNIVVKRPDGEVNLKFEAVANPGTGETIGDTSQFVAKAEWIAEENSFDAVLPEITVLGKVYRNVAFNYPKGN